MKTSFISLLLAFLFINSFAQAPLSFNYQGIARDSKGKELASKSISLQLSILINSATGTTVYTETHTVTTNGYGLFTVKVGAGKLISGKFNAINWTTGTYFLKVEMDPAGGTAFALMGTSQLISVPYAMMSNVSLKALNDLDTSATNELQIIKFKNDTLYLDRGGYVYLGNYDDKKAIQSIKNKLITDSTFFDTKIKDEKTDRQTNDYIINQKIITDSNYLKGLINTNTTNITNETNSRISNDQILKSKQISDSTYLKGLVNTNNTNLTTEINSRITGDNNLKIKVVADSSYLKGLINTTNTNLTTETNSRITGDNNLKIKHASDSSMFAGYLNTTMTNLTNETNSRITGDNTLKTKIVADSTYLKGLITTETNNRTNADNTLQTNITNETNLRISGDNGIRTKMISDSSAIRTIVNTTNTNLATTNTNLTTEINSRITGDNNLKTKIVADSTYLKGQINTTNTNLTTETNSRITGDNNLKTKEVSDSSYLKGQINTTTTNLSAEITNRNNGDNTLQTNINNLKSKEISDSSFLRNMINTTNTNSVTITGTQSISGNKTFTGIISVKSPINSTDAVNKAYVDSLKLKVTSLEDMLTDAGLFEIKDVCGNSYHIIRIGTQTWMKDNLKTTKYNNGDTIPNITNATTWSSLNTGAYCNNNNDPSNATTYGRLYNFYSVSDSRKICPNGWHIPTDVEWSTLENYLIVNGYNYDGTITGNKIAKALSATTYWTTSTNTGAIGNSDYPSKQNASGFTALPGCYRDNFGSFTVNGVGSSWWSSTDYTTGTAWRRSMYYSSTNVGRNDDYKISGFSVRCLRDY